MLGAFICHGAHMHMSSPRSLAQVFEEKIHEKEEEKKSREHERRMKQRELEARQLSA